MTTMKKQILTILILCALTLTSFSALSPMEVNAAASDGSVLSYTWHVSTADEKAVNVGSLVVIGEMQNVGTTNILYAYVTARAFVNDTEVALAQRQPYGNNLKPQQKAPFYLEFLPAESITSDLSWVSNVTDVVVQVTYAVNTDLDMYQGLTVSSTSQTSSSGLYTVVGAVKNEGSETIGDVRVVTTFYNSNGTVVSLNYTEVLSTALSPGASVNFVATPVAASSAGEIASYATLVQSTIKVPDTTTAPTSTPTPTSTGTPPSTTTPTPTSDQESQDYTLIIAVAVVLVVVVLAAVVLLTRKKGKVDLAPAQ